MSGQFSADSINGTRFELIRKIGCGSVGEIYLAIDPINNQTVAIKVENANTSNYLENEVKVYRNLQGGVGVPRIFYYGPNGSYNFLVMELLGLNLKNLFQHCSSRFSMKTVSMIAIQAISQLQFLHDKHYIHRDIKPENFVMGVQLQFKRLYLIDFGLSQKYRNEVTLEHENYEENQFLCGSYMYASRNTHQGIKQSRRDDMESLGYVLIHLILGTLPWQYVSGYDRRRRMARSGEIKMSTQPAELCMHLPRQFLVYLRYCQSLEYEEQPDYDYMIKLFGTLIAEIGTTFDYKYDWSMLRIDPTRDPLSFMPTLQNNFQVQRPVPPLVPLSFCT